MSRVDIVKTSHIIRTARVMQVEGIFDVSPLQRSEERWSVDIALPDAWNVGAIVGPSGSGKTTVARELFGAHIAHTWEWPEDKSILDGFPKETGIKDIIDLLSSVGFSSPPSWVRPFHVLSNGEQFRVHMARTLAEMRDLSVVDEFTSVIDRTVAQIGSAAIAKTVRRRNQQFIAVTCHYDVLDWLEPDWVYQPHTGEFYTGRGLHCRPPINLTVQRVHSSAWQLFRKHHYLDTSLNTSALCFVAFWNKTPVAFASMLHFVHPKRKRTKREHRTVCLPDFQGVGIGNKLSAYLGAMCKSMGFSYISTTTHPGMIRARNLSNEWRLTRPPGFTSAGKDRADLDLRGTHATTRLSASFEYVGSALSAEEARRMWNG